MHEPPEIHVEQLPGLVLGGFFDRAEIADAGVVDKHVDPAGNRDFKKSDFEWLGVIACLKNSGMPVKQIRQYIEWGMEGDDTLKQRLGVFETHRNAVLEKIAELQGYMNKIDDKIRYYKTAIAHGTTAVHAETDCVFTEAP
ncbi:DNA-binding transcriptional regulator, MerR family [Paenibacillus sp. UNC496MF]|uniref:MerR family transcriptional regulator n=1 Tax=Paenibacillus sp. UNC496MF TaxID=1502753 RepID=UPI0008E958C5|nr:MerR family transcriptional regulator [Paenibacillus sp. UNC496MF]SFI41201.1 DNA-binding transcriptional regulator, MerR family [Paenibacillus sp. UNC496MF]